MSKIQIINIESDENYYNTEYQISKRNNVKFVDNSSPSLSPDRSKVFGLFQLKSTFDNSVVVNSPVYPTSSTVIDQSGAPRKLLSPNIDVFSSSSVDVYKNGVEITQNRHWTAGVVKITAGTPGHLYDKTSYGFNELDILSSDRYTEITDASGTTRKIPSSSVGAFSSFDGYVEIDVFDPVVFLEKGLGDFIYPIVTSDVNQLENYILNGIIEPFPIRPVISNFSINFPFEPHSTRGQFGMGNINWRGATDSVETVFVYEPKRKNLAFFLDSSDIRKLSTEATAITGTVPVGPPDGYFNTDENVVPPYIDKINPRNDEVTSSYSNELLSVVEMMTGSSINHENYVNSGEKSSTSGFVCEYSNIGTDSIAFSNLTWNVDNRKNRRHRRDILNLRDSESFIKANTQFSDDSTIFFSTGSNMTVEYPAMIPLELTASMGLDLTTKSELFKTGSIRVTQGVRSSIYEQPLSDSRLSAKRRLGTL